LFDLATNGFWSEEGIPGVRGPVSIPSCPAFNIAAM